MEQNNTISLNSVEDYLENLSFCSKNWYQDDIFSWIFRGHGKLSYLLLPSLYRKRNGNEIYSIIFSKIHRLMVGGVPELEKTIRNIVKHYNLHEPYQERLIEIIKSRFVELFLVESFLDKCNKIRLFIPDLRVFRDQPYPFKGVDFLYSRLEELIKKFLRTGDKHPNYVYMPDAQLYHNFLVFDYPESVALARHHGIHNSFLDWTRNPLTAAFFSNYKNGKEPGGICVWALNCKLILNTVDNGLIEFHERLKYQGLDFLYMQQGLFTEMKGIDSYYFHNGKWPTVNEYLIKTKLKQVNP